MSEMNPSKSDHPRLKKDFGHKKRSSFFPETPLQRSMALALFAFLLLMAFGLGYLVASNKLSAWFLIQRSLPCSPAWRYIDDELLFPILGMALGVFVLKFCYNALRRIPTRLASITTGLGIALLVVSVFLADEQTNMMVVAAFCFLFTVYVLTGPPLPLTISILVFYAIGMVVTGGAGTGMLVGLLAIGLSMYPRGISAKRLIHPKRGVF